MWRWILTGCLLAGLAGGSADADTVTIHDQTFLTSSWEAYNRSSSGVSISISRGVGAGLTGDSRIINIGGLSAGKRYRVDNYFAGIVEYPDPQGMIQTISWELWYKCSGSNTWGSVYLIARQGDREFYAPNSYREPANFLSSWQRHSGTVSIHDFVRFSGAGPDTLVTNPNGAPIQFGYRCFSTIDLPGSVAHQVSFFTVTLGTVTVGVPLSGLTARTKLRLTPEGFAGRRLAFRIEAPAGEPLRVAAFDLSGRLVEVLYDGACPSSGVELAWAGSRRRGGTADPGVYFVRASLLSGVASSCRAVLLR